MSKTEKEVNKKGALSEIIAAEIEMFRAFVKESTGEDVLLLADYFLQRYIHKYKKEINGLSREAKQKLMRYHWPGNVRELQHAIERAVILSDSSLLKPANFMLQPQPEKKVDTDEILNLEQLERHAIERAMKRSEGNLSRAAEYLGITRYALYRKLEKLGL